MIDISSKRGDPLKAVAYLDGVDARIFKRLASRLGSQEKAQNAIILVGLLHDLGKVRTKSSSMRMQAVKVYFKEELGMSWEELDSILEDV